MRKLIMWNLITLDGYFEGSKPWDLEWHGSVWGPELEQFCIEQLQTTDLLLFGRATYQGMAAYWQGAEGEVADFMNRLPKVVVSRTLEGAEWNNTRLVSQDVAQEIAQLKQAGSGNMFLFGSANLATTLMKQNLIDEYRIAVAPVVLGGGTPLFKPGDRRDFRLLDARTLASGGVILRYAPNPC